MALKPYRDINAQRDTSFYMNVAAEAGLILCITDGAGVVGDGKDDSARLLEVAVDPDGLAVAGVLECDVVVVDTTKYSLNGSTSDVQAGGKVPVIVKGFVVTNKTTSGGTATTGDTAVLKANGEIEDAGAGWTPQTAAEPHVGTFQTDKDANGFVRVYVDPQNLHRL